MHTPKPLPECHAEMDGHHLRVFRHHLPWWFRPVRDASEYDVPDFVRDVHNRMKAVLARVEPSMGAIFEKRRIFAEAISYRIARHSATIAKTGSGPEEFLTCMRDLVAHMHKYECLIIPQGDPLFGKYRDRDLTAPEKQLVHWFGGRDALCDLLHQPEFSAYLSRSPEARCVVFVPELRRKMWKILAEANGDGDGWRDPCIEAAIEEMIRIGGETQQKRVDALTEHCSYDPLTEDPQRSLADLVTPHITDPKKKDELFALLEQLIVVAAEKRNTDNLLAIVKVWNRLMAIHDVAPCERPTGGLAGVIAKCSAEEMEEVRGWLGPKPA